MLEFRGIQKTTLADYPGEVACTLFMSGCNFRCSYCYNPDLALSRDTGVTITEDEALGFLEERRSFLDGVCVTGGEPLLQHGLLNFLRKAKALGYKVKLDTNGSQPEHLCRIIEEKAVDYIAMDVKTTPERYQQVAGDTVEIEKLEASARLIKESGVDYEFRTTVYSDLKTEDFDRIGRWLGGGKKYCVQPVKTHVPLLDKDFAQNHTAAGPDKLKSIARRLADYFEQVEIRS